jgi:hypothetical protein
MRSTLPKNIMQQQQQQQNVGYVHTPRASSHYSDYSIDRKGYYYTRPSTVSSTNSMKSTRNQTISESDSVFLPPSSNGGESDGVQPHYVVVNSEKLRPVDVLKMQQYNSQQQKRAGLYSEPERIYDVVYSSTASSRKNSASENGSGYGNINLNRDRSQQVKLLQRPASAMSSPMVYQNNRPAVNGRMTPLVLHPQYAPRQGDIIINNQLYRPISEIPTTNTSPAMKQPVQPIYSTPLRKRQTAINNHHNTYESDSEAGEIQSIMQKKYGEFVLNVFFLKPYECSSRNI